MTMLLICCLIIGPNYTAINFIKRNSYHCSFGRSVGGPALNNTPSNKSPIIQARTIGLAYCPTGGSSCFPPVENRLQCANTIAAWFKPLFGCSTLARQSFCSWSCKERGGSVPQRTVSISGATRGGRGAEPVTASECHYLIS